MSSFSGEHYTSVTLQKAVGLRNIFVKIWKPNFATDPKMRLSSIAFMRNLIEFTNGPTGSDYEKLTSLLHYKADTETITQTELDTIYLNLFKDRKVFPDGRQPVFKMILEEAEKCLAAGAGVNFENKIVLAIAIRMLAEKFIFSKLATRPTEDELKSNQTAVLAEKFYAALPGEVEAIRTIRKAVLMTPESIHLNSFMYEPILDMSDDHLRKLYEEVKNLK